jgi:O-antigen/teichoic acid export membrane protein
MFQHKFEKEALRKNIKYIIWLITERGITLLLTLASGVLIVRYLGLQQFGQISYVISFVGLFGFLPTLALKHVAIRDLTEDSGNKDDYFLTLFYSHIGGATVSYLLILMSGIVIGSKEDTLVYMLLYGTIVFSQIFQLAEYELYATRKIRKIAVSYVIGAVIGNIIRIFIVWKQLSLYWFAIAYTIDAFIGGILMYFFSQNSIQLKLLNGNFSFPILKSLLKQSIYLLISYSLSLIYLKIDQVMIVNMISEKENAIYAAAVKISEMWYIVPAVLNNLFTVALTNAKAKGETLYQERLQQMYMLYAWLGIFAAIFTTLFAELIITKLYGIEYQEAAKVLKVHVWAGVFIFLGFGSYSNLLQENKYHLLVVISFSGAISNIILNYFLIPTYGSMGAAIATVFSYFILNYVMLGIIPFTRKIFIMQTKGIFFPILFLWKALRGK